MEPPAATIEIPQRPSTRVMGAAYPLPPLFYSGNRQLTIMFKTVPEVLARLVPAPLQPNPNHLIGFYSALMHVTAPEELTYKEHGLIVPVSFGERAGRFVACMYLDSTAPIIGGREIWGFPKQQAEITYAEERGEVTTAAERSRIPLFRASMRLETRVTDIPASPQGPFFTLKVIPAVRQDAPPDVLQLTSTAFSPHTTELYVGPARLEIGRLPLDPPGDIPILGIASARLAVYDAVLDYGEVLADFLAPR